MANVNKTMLLGRLTREPELRHTSSGMAVCELGMAVNRTYKTQGGEKKEETTFVDVTCWGKTAELAAQYLQKGREVFIEGYLKYDQWEKDGQKRSKLSVVAEGLQFIGGGKGGGRQDDHSEHFSGPAEAKSDRDDFEF